MTLELNASERRELKGLGARQQQIQQAAQELDADRQAILMEIAQRLGLPETALTSNQFTINQLWQVVPSSPQNGTPQIGRMVEVPVAPPIVDGKGSE